MAANFVPIIQASEASRVGGLEGLRQAWKDFAKMALQHMFAASRQCKEASDCRDELIIVRENMIQVIVNVPTIQFLQQLCNMFLTGALDIQFKKELKRKPELGY